ncbi:copper amine oxidase [Mycena floridula]|nr:copper amine oxidase [Mycena floridula]
MSSSKYGLIEPTITKRRFRFGIWGLLLAISLAALLLRQSTVQLTEAPLQPQSLNDFDPLKQCVSPEAPQAKPPVPLNVWASLTVPETVQIQAWLESPEQNLNLTRAADSVLSDNIIFMIEAYYPAKADALTYLAGGAAPERYARVTIHHGAAAIPVIRDYLVGPIPVGKTTSMRQLTEIYHQADIPFNARGFVSLNELLILLSSFTPAFEEAMMDLFGCVAKGQANDTLVGGMSAPFSFDGSFRRTWISWRRNVAGPWLHPVNLFQYVDMTGTDASTWKVLKVVYNHQIFSGTDEFLAAWRNSTLIRPPHRPDQTGDLSWTTRKKIGTQRDLDHLPGPRSVSFAGLRFRVDKKSQFVSWMGWSMYLGFDRDMGLSLWDIRLKGERLIYQLAPQEALAQYAGNDPMQSTTVWMDRLFGMGNSVRDMLPGYDCPHESVYLPATTYSSMESIVREKAICIFEQDTGRPITRHFGFMQGEFGAVKGYALTIRSISTFDYTFHLDGTIEVRLSASGYLQGGFWEPKQAGYGAKIRDTTMGNLHDHVINFKIDLDIVGERNSFMETKTAQEEVEQPWFDSDWGSTVIQQKITKTIIENEDDAKVKYPSNFQGGYAIINQAEKNSWGHPRGYAIHPGSSPVHNTVVGSKRMLNNANFARYNLAVSRRKETEPSSSSMWNGNLPGLPTVDFHKFFDGENITQEDLVLWINLGTHHLASCFMSLILPQAEDSPNTKTNVATSSFMLTPLNYFDSDIAMESSNAILLNIPEVPGPFTFDDYGVQQDYTCIPEAPAPFEYIPAKTYDAEGQLMASTVEEMRKNAEMYHRIKVE